MVEKETTEFSRESFKEKILRQLEEGNEGKRPEQSTQRELKSENFAQSFSSEEETKPTFDFQKSSQKEDENITKHDFLQASNEPYHFDRKSFEQKSTLRDRLEETGELTDISEPTHYSRSAVSADKEDEEDDEVKPKRKSSKKSQNNKKKNKKKDKKQKNTAGRIIAVIVIVLILTAGATGWYGYNFVQTGLQPLNTKDTTVKAINIPAGASSKQIGTILEKDNIIKNGMIFQYYTKFKNYTGFKSGYYNLSPNMTLSSIATELQKGGTAKPVAPSLGKITIPEGYTLAQIAKQVTVNSAVKNGKTPFTEAEFLKVVQDPTFISKMAALYPDLFKSLPTKASGVKYQLEGYLFPATYEYTKSSTAETIAASMIQAMNTQLTPYYAQIATSHKTVNEVLSLAAIVEKEANNDDDRRNVAGTFNNRIAAGMTLDSNTTVLYAEGKLGTTTTLAEDASINTSLNSPYNTYMYQGYGPGPIDNPSLSSIKAVLEPTTNAYYYFVADVTTGKVYFAKTLAEQNVNVQKYVNSKLSK
ncbi:MULTISPECIES: endolytic transglycosylase MltG [unclassified Lactococcus]|uniref:endolytic transglycosylase MltG n=1 Tax=unclassified Lactococcus TaxID=2643510 RepID=UPI0011C79E0E|nr:MULTISPECIES: endolytic transglycosylase MltG [unclassified Lactococcus]MQW22418.1 endolytic transglycosylase MltG [Lactococcus sp. dk101]TXK45451.1 endolytic transglycosylase MltG [Lactococcus sp. dk310]TXK51784.1 endolytic transglycosylase MltG [Lactococcus sp. dk322]